MKIHEYQGKELLKRYGVAVPKGKAAMSLKEADEAIRWVQDETKSPVVVVKAQIHAGGRGKGGGVKVAKTLEDAQAKAKQIFGMTLVTHQTGPEGKKVNRLLIEQGVDIARELYIGLALDRTNGRVTVMASTEGGMEVEEVAEKHPEKILKAAIDPVWHLPGVAKRFDIDETELRLLYQPLGIEQLQQGGIAGGITEPGEF